jgi:hypothetical protein
MLSILPPLSLPIQQPTRESIILHTSPVKPSLVFDWIASLEYGEGFGESWALDPMFALFKDGPCQRQRRVSSQPGAQPQDLRSRPSARAEGPVHLGLDGKQAPRNTIRANVHGNECGANHGDETGFQPLSGKKSRGPGASPQAGMNRAFGPVVARGFFDIDLDTCA